MGQSNMSGRGQIQDLPADFPKHPQKLWLFSNAEQWQLAQEPLDRAEGQVDLVSADRGAGVGPGLAMADELVRLYPKRSVGLVPCAKGGVSIRQWKRDLARTSLYGSCLARIRKAQERGLIKGVLWYQGESDSDSLEAARAWPGLFSEMIVQLRRDLKMESLPVVYAQIARISPERRVQDKSLRFWDEVRAQQKTVSLARVKMIETDSLELSPDGLHLSTAAQLQLGKILAQSLEAFE